MWVAQGNVASVLVKRDNRVASKRNGEKQVQVISMKVEINHSLRYNLFAFKKIKSFNFFL